MFEDILEGMEPKKKEETAAGPPEQISFDDAWDYYSVRDTEDDDEKKKTWDELFDSILFVSNI